jgi:large subunit ribosomal protein L32
MSVPKKRISKKRTRSRRAHHALDAPAVMTCPKCKNGMQPHRACPSCGFYRGRNVLKRQSAAEKKITAKKKTTKK